MNSKFYIVDIFHGSKIIHYGSYESCIVDIVNKILNCK